MKNLNDVNNLAELLQALRHESSPMFINLCSRCGDEGFLMDRVVSNLQKEYSKKLGYKKLPVNASKVIQEELMISRNPVLLLINGGEIKAIFDGISAQFRLEIALANLENPQSI